MKKLQRRGDEKKKYSLIIDYIQVLQQLAMETRQRTSSAAAKGKDRGVIATNEREGSATTGPPGNNGTRR